MLAHGVRAAIADALAFAAGIENGALHQDVNELLFADLGTHYDLRPGLRKVDRPVLIVQGHQDPIGDKTAEDIHALIPGSAPTYLNKSGHFPWIERPDDFRRALAEFLAKPS